jgi:hypothetical protein
MYKVENHGTYIFVSVDEQYQQYESSMTKVSDSAGSLERIVNESLDEVSHRVPLVIDLRHFKISWSELVMSLSESKKSDSVFVHRNLDKLLIVTENGLLKLGAMALGQAQYGSKTVTVFKTVEEAMAVVGQPA